MSTFRKDDTTKEIVGERDTPTGRALFVARPIQVANQDCLVCHSTPSAAPKSMLNLYGEASGFGWKMNEIIGAQVVPVPMSLPIENANRVQPAAATQRRGISRRAGLRRLANPRGTARVR